MKTEKRTNIFKIEQLWVNMQIEEMGTLPVDAHNFHICTVANWTEVDNVDFKANYKSDSGSEYMITKDGVYRKSDHWFYGVASCAWTLDGKESIKDTIAFCSFENFKKYSHKKDNAVNENIQNMLRGEMVLAHRIGELINTKTK